MPMQPPPLDPETDFCQTGGHAATVDTRTRKLNLQKPAKDNWSACQVQSGAVTATSKPYKKDLFTFIYT